MKNKGIFSTQMIVEAGIMMGLALVLSIIKIWQMPYGGSVTLGSMIPIFIFALRWGIMPGLVVGTTYGVLQFFVDGYALHIFSLLLDYLLAFGVLGLAGIFTRKNELSRPKAVWGITFAIILRFVSHYLSGVFIFYEYAGDQSKYLYSLIYNGTYLLPELVISLAIIIPFYPFIKRLLNRNV